MNLTYKNSFSLKGSFQQGNQFVTIMPEQQHRLIGFMFLLVWLNSRFGVERNKIHIIYSTFSWLVQQHYSIKCIQLLLIG